MKDWLHKENYKKVLDFLESKNLLKQNQEIVSSLDDDELGCCYQFLRVITYLSNCNLLDQESLKSLIAITQTKPIAMYSWAEPTELYDSGIFNLLNTLDDSKINIGKKELDILLHLKKTNLERLTKVTNGLIKAKLLDDNSFSKALLRVTKKLPQVVPATAVKKSRHVTGSSKSETTLDGVVRVFSEPGKKNQDDLALSEIQGNSAPVKKGYSKSDDDNAMFIIKTIGRAYMRSSQDDEREAKREVKYNRLLGRAAFYFFKEKNPNPRVAAEFVSGKEVSALCKSELQKTSFETRLHCIASGLTNIDILHSHHRVHGDITQRNFFIDLKNATMKLIDFGSSHKMDSPKSTGFETNPVYDDPTHLSNDFYRDLYSTGIVITQLFPELYSVTYQQRTGTKIQLIKTSDLTSVEQSIINLVNALTHLDLTKRSTSESAVSYCNQIIQTINNLNEKTLQEITDSTINRADPTVEDVIRRPWY